MTMKFSGTKPMSYIEMQRIFKSCLFGIFILVTSLAWSNTTNVAPKPVDAAVSEETQLVDAINKELRSELPRYNYAFFLYTKKRFPEATVQLGYLMALNPQHEKGKLLAKHINEIAGLADAAYQEKQMAAFMSQLDQMGKKENEEPQKLTEQKIVEIRKELDRKYSFSIKIKSEFQPSPAEKVFETEVIKAHNAGKFDLAERLAKERMNRFEDSPLAKADFIHFLIVRDRIPQAEVLLKQANENHPGALKLLLLTEAMKEMKKVKSIEQTKDIKIRLNEHLEVYALTQSSPNRAAASVEAKDPTPSKATP